MIRRAADIGVALVDPIPLFRMGLSQWVERSPGLRWVGATGNLHSAIQLVERLRPDVLLVDSVLDPNGHLVKLLTRAESRLAVLVLVREPYRNTRFVNDLLVAGAHGITLRGVEPERLLDAIVSTFIDRAYVDPAFPLVFGARRPARPRVGRHLLSRREYQVLQLLSDGLENQVIAEVLVLSVETVRTHVKSILRKLRVRDRTHAVSTAFRTGLLAPHEERRFTLRPVDPSRRT